MSHPTLPQASGAYPQCSSSPMMQQPPTSDKSFVLTWLLSLFLGGLGVDRFYLGKLWTGVFKLITLGGLGVWAFVDIIITIAGAQTDKRGLKLKNYHQHKVLAIVLTIILMLLGAVGGLVGGITAAAFSSSAGSSAGGQLTPANTLRQEVELGTPFNVDFGQGNVAKITIADASYADELPGPGTRVSTPKNGRYLVLDVRWETEAGVTTANPLYFTARGESGQKVFAHSVSSDGAMGFGQVAAGEQLSGTVDLDVAPGVVTVIVDIPRVGEVAQMQGTVP